MIHEWPHTPSAERGRKQGYGLAEFLSRAGNYPRKVFTRHVLPFDESIDIVVLQSKSNDKVKSPSLTVCCRSYSTRYSKDSPHTRYGVLCYKPQNGSLVNLCTSSKSLYSPGEGLGGEGVWGRGMGSGGWRSVVLPKKAPLSSVVKSLS